jgi:hypothetical protein
MKCRPIECFKRKGIVNISGEAQRLLNDLSRISSMVEQVRGRPVKLLQKGRFERPMKGMADKGEYNSSVCNCAAGDPGGRMITQSECKGQAQSHELLVKGRRVRNAFKYRKKAIDIGIRVTGS